MPTVVAGLSWDAPGNADASASLHPDLDLACVLLDEAGGIVECVHPGRTHTSDSSVLHTGDSKTGAGVWDDERVFVFLHALSARVSAAAILVTSAARNSFGDTRNASCHITNHTTDEELYRVDFRERAADSVYCVATLSRMFDGWEIVPGARSDAELKALVEGYPSHCAG